MDTSSKMIFKAKKLRKTKSRASSLTAEPANEFK